ncbi:hypothetical protein BpHYR1_027514 [Brachionus plicatilis]|uniref:Secreted protein n=1 Tax=Brachionus plicatilis TaxID=10195 RepID=A0A3M7RYG8_BRAPC|nr:hypothetical protein BpHYR1_027514 [Brachionus plicatilis]
MSPNTTLNIRIFCLIKTIALLMHKLRLTKLLFDEESNNFVISKYVLCLQRICRHKFCGLFFVATACSADYGEKRNF